MAVKEKTTGFREILSSLKKKNYASFYLFAGDEDYYIDILMKELEDNVIEEDFKDFNQTVYYGADTELSSVIASAQQYPVYPGLQLVILKESQAMYGFKSQLEKLDSYLSNPNLSTILVVSYKGEISLGNTSFYKKLKSSDKFIYFKGERLKDYQLPRELSDYCNSKGFNIDEKALNLLCDYVGGPLSKLFGEADKLFIGKPNDRKVITAEDVESNIGISKDYNTFELVKAIGRKDFGKAMFIINYFSNDTKQNPGVMIVAALFNFFSKLFIATLCQDRSDANLMKELDLKNSYALRDYKDALRFYDYRQVMQAIHFIRNHDAMSKGVGSFQNEYELLKELVFKIISC